MASLSPPPTKTTEFSFIWRNWISFLYNFLQVENWHEVGDSGEPAFENSWVNFESSNAVAAFYKDSFDRVWVKGLVKTGTPPSTVFTLPAGYRPSEIYRFASISNDAISHIAVQPTGIVTVQVGSAVWASINMSFRV